MTGQIADRVWWEDEAYSLLEFVAPEAFKARIFSLMGLGIMPRSSHTGLWRGHHIDYGVQRGVFMVKHVRVNLEPRDEGRLIAGRAPVRAARYADGFDDLCTHKYEGLDLAQRYFSGRVLIARELIQGLYVHMGFQEPWRFEQVMTLRIEQGICVGHQDWSAQIAALREAHVPAPDEHGVVRLEPGQLRALTDRLWELIGRE